MNASTTAEDPAEIEREIRRTQNNMSSTVDKIGDQLSVKNVFNALLDRADNNNVDARMLIDGARRNPVALALIAAGAIWLVSDKDAKLPSLGSMSFKKTDKATTSTNASHSDYMSHMAAIEQNPDEDAEAYQRRRDAARANFFMLERDQGEDESNFRQRLDTVTSTFRQKRHDWANGAGQARSAAKEQASAAAGKAQDLYSENPLVGGLLAMAVGAAFGSALPITRRERDTLGAVGEKARDVVGQRTEEMTGKIREKKDEYLDKADAALKQSSSSSTSADASVDNMQQKTEAPFMIGR